MKRRIERINSLLREVIAQVIRRDVQHREVHPLTTVSYVEVTDDLAHAKVFLSIIGTETDKKKTVAALRSAAGFISCCAASQVTLRHFPRLSFYIDESVEKQARINEILAKIHDEEANRSVPPHASNQ
jgi:ribosome-binding factor A